MDIALYPLDTIKTRLQSAEGFIKAGGFKGVYAGLGAGAIGSAPGSMFFFSTYEGVKKVMGSRYVARHPSWMSLCPFRSVAHGRTHRKAYHGGGCAAARHPPVTLLQGLAVT